jgi:hypothetical protein
MHCEKVSVIILSSLAERSTRTFSNGATAVTPRAPAPRTHPGSDLVFALNTLYFYHQRNVRIHNPGGDVVTVFASPFGVTDAAHQYVDPPVLWSLKLTTPMRTKITLVLSTTSTATAPTSHLTSLLNETCEGEV